MTMTSLIAAARKSKRNRFVYKWFISYIDSNYRNVNQNSESVETPYELKNKSG